MEAQIKHERVEKIEMPSEKHKFVHSHS